MSYVFFLYYMIKKLLFIIIIINININIRIGEFSSPMEALQYIADRKRISVDYLTIPSQQRYVQYFSNMLDGVKPRSEHLLLRRVIINAIPNYGSNGTEVGCCPYIQLFKNGKLISTAVPTTR